MSSSPARGRGRRALRGNARGAASAGFRARRGRTAPAVTEDLRAPGRASPGHRAGRRPRQAAGATEAPRALERRLPLLTAGTWDAPARQWTLSAAIDWSFGLLDPDEQELFARLSVFSADSRSRPPKPSVPRRSTGSPRSWTRACWRSAPPRPETTGSPCSRPCASTRTGNSRCGPRSRTSDAATPSTSLHSAGGGSRRPRRSGRSREAGRGALGGARQPPGGDRLAQGGRRDRERASPGYFRRTGCSGRHTEIELHRWLLWRSSERTASSRGSEQLVSARPRFPPTTPRRPRGREYAEDSLALARELGDERQVEFALRVLSFDEPASGGAPAASPRVPASPRESRRRSGSGLGEGVVRLD